MHQVHFKRLLKENLQFKEICKFYRYHKKHFFKQLLTQLIAVYFSGTAANTLAEDPSFKFVLDNLVASQLTFSRFIKQISTEDLAWITKLVKLAQLVNTQKR